MGKLFGRERKSSNEQKDTGGDLNAFLHGPGDSLPVAHAAPQMLAKLDTHAAPRYPNALSVDTAAQHGVASRPRSHSPRVRSRKGLVVRFVDTFPDIIGEGGDECEMPVAEVGRRRRAKAPGPAAPPRPAKLGDQPRAHSELKNPQESFVPAPLRRTQTGYSSIAEAPEREVPAGTASSAPFLDSPVVSKDDKRKSFIELHQAEMREAEGLAFAKAVRAGTPVQTWEVDKPPRQSPSIPDSPASSTEHRGVADSPEAARPKRTAIEQSPSSLYSTASSINRAYSAYRQNSKLSDKEAGSPSSPLKASMNLHEVVVAAGDDALDCFVSRTRHLFELFRLHSETVRPLQANTISDLARAALWWFLHGRMALESAVREQPQTTQGQRANEMALQQAYADLAKSYWLSGEVLSEVIEAKHSPVDNEVDDVRGAVQSSLRKLAVSMKRNDFLPPEEALLPQAIDKAIWVEYPPVSQDIKSLLWGQWGSALASSRGPAPTLSLLESLPIGDTPQHFSFGRVPAELYLMEQGIESQQVHFPCLLSMVRPLNHTDVTFVIASQNGAVQLRIQSNKNAGPTWDDLRWRSDTRTIDLNLPRGFKLTIRFTPQDFGILWGIYDFGSRVQSYLWNRKDEHTLFRSALKAFQYFDSDPQSRQFPKEPVPDCEVALFERILREGSPTGPRSFHRGCRIAVVTGTKTRTLCGINHAFLPQTTVQFGFLRGDQGDPALLLKFESSRSNGSMVLSFKDDKERLRFHNLLVGTALLNDEHILAEVPLVSMTVSQSLKDTNGIPTFKKLPYQRLRIINYEDGSDNPPTVLADKLRMVVEFKNGTMTDRVNVAPGELKIRLDVNDTKTLAVLRQPQQDMTAAVSEAQVPRELGRELTEGLALAREAATVRRYQFTTMRDLHDVQAALTGFKVVFDGIAATFAISRRRMVVPIHKKWEAGATRVQVVQQQQDKGAVVVQLLAFFQDWQHGQSMGFVLKGTDDFEAFGRGSKAGLKIDDAKFPLPRVASEDTGPVGDDAAFVCLDLPDLPGEHDDITIVFDKEAGKFRGGEARREEEGHANKNTRSRPARLVPARPRAERAAVEEILTPPRRDIILWL